MLKPDLCQEFAGKPSHSGHRVRSLHGGTRHVTLTLDPILQGRSPKLSVPDPCAQSRTVGPCVKRDEAATRDPGLQ